jgi:hypothetical protein
MKISIHPDIIGKPVRRTEGDQSWTECNGKRLNLGRGWQNIESDWESIFELITVDGYATSAELSGDRRAEETFVSRELVMIDIDSGMSIQQLLDDDFYKQYSAGYYTTPSHREELPRFRIMFRLQTPIVDSTRLQKLNKMLLKVFVQADAACKDATRIFYGSPDCSAKQMTSTIIADDTVEAFVQAYDQQEQEQMQNRWSYDRSELTDESKKKIIELLKSTYVGEYATWRNIGWGLKAGGFSVDDFCYVTQGMMTQKTNRMAIDVWSAGRASGNITMGTVIWFIKQRHGENCLKTQDTVAGRAERELSTLAKNILRKIRNE